MLIYIPIALVTLLFIAHIALGVKLKGIMGIIYIGIGFYWLMAFSIRPWYWILEKPNSYALLGDTRLANSDYGQPLIYVLLLVALGESIFLAISYFVFRKRIHGDWDRSRFAQTLLPLTSRKFLTSISIFYVFGWIGRFALASDVPILGTALIPFGIVSAATLIIFSKFWSKNFFPPHIAILVGLEFVWAFSLGSKASAFVPLLALACRWNVIPNRKSGSWKFLALLTMVGTISFQIIQTRRGILNEEVYMARSESGANPLRGFLISVIERFDGAVAIVDAYAAQTISKWMTVYEYLGRASLNLTPRVLFTSDLETVGQQWTREVVSQSKSFQYQDVSLASGFWAEGLALSGLSGLVILAIIQSLFVSKVVSKVETGNVYWYLLLSFTIFSPALWEQGILGGSAAIGKGIQIVVVYFFIQAIVEVIYNSKGAIPESSGINRSNLPMSFKDRGNGI